MNRRNPSQKDTFMPSASPSLQKDLPAIVRNSLTVEPEQNAISQLYEKLNHSAQEKLLT